MKNPEIRKSSINKSNKKIELYRGKINRLDRKLIKLILKRIKKVKIIGSIKKSEGISINNEKRENEILKAIDRISRNPDLSEHIKTIYKTIFEISKKIEKEEP